MALVSIWPLCWRLGCVTKLLPSHLRLMLLLGVPERWSEIVWFNTNKEDGEINDGIQLSIACKLSWEGGKKEASFPRCRGMRKLAWDSPTSMPLPNHWCCCLLLPVWFPWITWFGSAWWSPTIGNHRQATWGGCEMAPYTLLGLTALKKWLERVWSWVGRVVKYGFVCSGARFAKSEKNLKIAEATAFAKEFFP